ncbi:MAG: FHA domain-containing protein [Nannocystaceae bacterium]|nr:FHA domain-containing protein [Nannocystaceae bacterium]
MRGVRITVNNRATGESVVHEFQTSPVRIGRNPLNDLPLRYPFVSGWHAVIRFDDHGARFFDLGSTNGTLKDGRRVVVGEEVVIDGPAVVQLGDLDLTMTRTGAGAPAAAAPPQMGAPIVPGATGAVHAGVIDTDDPVALAPGTADPTSTMQVPMGRIHEAMGSLRPFHDRMRDARLAFEHHLRECVGQLPAHVRATAEQFMRREFEGTGGSGPAQPAGGPTGGGGAFTALAEQLLPGLAPPASEQEVQRFVASIRDVLEACAKGLVELQKGQEQFGHEMGVKAIKEFTPLNVAASAAEALEYLLDFRHGTPHRTQELVGVFADVMIHQVALLNGVAEGARALLMSLDPDEIERRSASTWGNSAKNRWKTFVARHGELVAEDKLWMEIMFGPEFARAYAEVGGEQTPADPTNVPTT